MRFVHLALLAVPAVLAPLALLSSSCSNLIPGLGGPPASSGEGEAAAEEGEDSHAGGEGEGAATVGEGEGAASGEGEGAASGEGEGAASTGEGEGEGTSSGDGTTQSPFVIASFPFHDDRDTTQSQESTLDGYSCAPTTDESGAEFVYTFTVTQKGSLTAHVDDGNNSGRDIDVHLLSAPSADQCIARGDSDVSAVIDAGTYFLVADTFAGNAGPYALDVDFHALTSGNCAMTTTDVRVFWGSCDPSITDCDTSSGEVVLHTPTSGPVVEEAHLATDADGFGDGWPTSFTDGIDNHYAVSQAASGYSVTRDQPWAPAGEGGSQFGQGATSGKVPVLDEAWYINMYWRDRPAGGTRMIVQANGKAVVVSAGWETGPGSNAAIAGVTEEVHHWLGTGHLDTLTIGFAEDQTLPLGPISCQ